MSYNKICGLFETLSLEEKINILQFFQANVRNERKHIFLATIPRYIIIETTENGYILLSYIDRPYKLNIYVDKFNDIKLGIVSDDVYHKSYFESICRISISEDIHLVYKCRYCNANGDYNNDSDTDVYFDNTKNCDNCDSKFLDVVCKYEHKDYLKIFNNYDIGHSEFVCNVLKNLYDYFHGIENIMNTTNEEFIRKHNFTR